MAIKVGSAVVGIRPEATAHTFDAPLAADCFPAYDITVKPEADTFENPETSSNFGKLDDSPGAASMEISFKTLLRGQGSTGPTIVPHMTDALQAAGFSLTLNATGTALATHTYKPTATFDGSGSGVGPLYPEESYSCSVLIDGIRYAAKGGMANCVLTWNLGEPPMAAFTFKGAYVARADSALLVPTGVSASVPPQFLGASSFVILDVGHIIESFEIDLGGTLAPLRDAKDSNGVLGYTISDRSITGKASIQDALTTGTALYAAWRAGTVGSLTSGVLGSAAGNRINVICPRIQYRTPTPGDKERVHTQELSFGVKIAGGGADGSDMSLAFS